MNLSDPVDAAALRMFNETNTYLLLLMVNDSPDPEPMTAATQAYAKALQASMGVTPNQIQQASTTACVCGDAAFCPRNGHPGCLMKDPTTPIHLGAPE